MFEGKHIHYSPIDQKPLCSYSTKLCRQRRLNGYAFCIRHILEDPTAPFRLCSFVAPPGQNKCSNVISNTHPRGLCNTHLQLAGFPAAKRERRHHKKDVRPPISFSPNGKLNPVVNEQAPSSVETSDGDPYAFSDDTEVAKFEDRAFENHKKLSQVNSPLHSPLGIQPLTPSSTSSSGVESNTEMNLCKKKQINVPNGVLSKVKPMKLIPDLKPKTPQPIKKKKIPKKGNWKTVMGPPLPAVLQQLHDKLNEPKSSYLLPQMISDSDDESSSSLLPYAYQRCWLVSDIPSKERCRAVKLQRNWNEIRRRYLQYAHSIQVEIDCEIDTRQKSSLFATKLLAAARRWPNETGLLLQGRRPGCPSSGLNPLNWKIFTKRRCSFRRSGPADGEKEEAVCTEFSLPCSTLCSRHILYSVDQQLFEFCAARGSGPTPCGAPVLAVHSGLPYCSVHATQTEHSTATVEICPTNGASNPGLNNKANRRKSRSRSTSLGRHSRRIRNRKRAKRIGESSGDSTIHCIESADNGMELDVETVDSPENCSPAYPTPAQLIPQPIAGSAVVVGAEQEVEMLEDHDLTEVLNRLPDEAFQEIFAAASSSRSGLFVPSREEAEELERALAAVDKDVPILEKYSAVANESDLSVLALIDDHTLALAHDLVMEAGPAAQSLLLGTETPSNSLFLDNSMLDNLNLHHSLINPGYHGESSSHVSARRRSLVVPHVVSQQSPARGSSPPSLTNHTGSFILENDSAAGPLCE